MDKFWLFVASATFVTIFSIRDFRRSRRHANRNAVGQCGMCAGQLGWSRVRQLSYRYSKFGPAETVDVCQKCFTRRRVKLGLIWLLAFAVCGVMVALPVLYPIVPAGR